LALQAHFQLRLNLSQGLQRAEGGIQIALFPDSLGGLLQDDALEMVRPADQVIIREAPDVPPDVILAQIALTPLPLALTQFYAPAPRQNVVPPYLTQPVKHLCPDLSVCFLFFVHFCSI